MQSTETPLARIDSVLQEYAELVADMETVTPSHLVHKIASALVEARSLIPAPPTGDDREALKFAITEGYWRRTGYRVDWKHIGALVDAIQSAGFRRDRGHGPITDGVRDAARRLLKDVNPVRLPPNKSLLADDIRLLAGAVLAGTSTDRQVDL